MLNGLLRKYGVDVIEQAEITGAVVEDGRCRALVTCSNGRERSYAARSFIIATGGALGEGLPGLRPKEPGNRSSIWIFRLRHLPPSGPGPNSFPQPRSGTGSPCSALMSTPA